MSITSFLLSSGFLVLNTGEEIWEEKKEEGDLSCSPIFPWESTNWLSNFSHLSVASGYTSFIQKTKAPFLTPHTATQMSQIRTAENTVLTCLSTMQSEVFQATVSEEWNWMWKHPVLGFKMTLHALRSSSFSWEVDPGVDSDQWPFEFFHFSTIDWKAILL